MEIMKNPFAPISLKGEEAQWFVDYLEGKVKIDPKIEKRRKQFLKEAEAEEINDSDEICLKI